jgi:hypothetical protein
LDTLRLLLFRGLGSGVAIIAVARIIGLLFEHRIRGQYKATLSPNWAYTTLVYSSTRRNSGRGVDIYIINVDGSGETALTHGKTKLYSGGFYPSWSPVP